MAPLSARGISASRRDDARATSTFEPQPAGAGEGRRDAESDEAAESKLFICSVYTIGATVQTGHVADTLDQTHR